jgi:nucleoside-diphosphate-sugar epimerase
MRVFIAGASGAVGRCLVPLAVGAGHQVTVMTLLEDKAGGLRAHGAEAVIANALDRAAVVAAVAKATPEVVVHQLTALSSFANAPVRPGIRSDQSAAHPGNDKSNRRGTRRRCPPVRRPEFRRLALCPLGRTGEDRGGRTRSRPSCKVSGDARRHSLFGTRGACGRRARWRRAALWRLLRTGTSLGEGGKYVEAVRRRRFPIIGGGTGVWSFIHIDDVASATLSAIERRAAGIDNIVDDEPAPVAEWLPFLASAIGAPPPRHIPAWLGRLLVGEHGLAIMDGVRGASNSKANREFGWQPHHASWREGFRKGLAD